MSNPKVTFDLHYLMQISMSHAEEIEMFKGKRLFAEVEFDEDSRVSGISVSFDDEVDK